MLLTFLPHLFFDSGCLPLGFYKEKIPAEQQDNADIQQNDQHLQQGKACVLGFFFAFAQNHQVLVRTIGGKVADVIAFEAVAKGIFVQI